MSIQLVMEVKGGGRRGYIDILKVLYHLAEIRKEVNK